MKATNRLKEAIKQARLAKQEVEDPDVSQELEDTIEGLQNSLEALEDDD